LKKIALLILVITTFNLSSQNKVSKLSEGDLYYNKGFHFFNTHKKDSAIYFFSKAISFYRIKNDSLNFVAALRKIAQINYDFGFLIKAETQAIEVLDIYEKIKKDKYQSHILNLLGNISKKKKDYNESIKYHEKALHIRKNKLNHLSLTLSSLNNISLVYQESGNYNKAIKYLDTALKFDSLKIKYPIKYAGLIDNKAYSLFLADSLISQILPLFNEALKIRTIENDIDGLTTSHLHLAEFYSKNKFSPKELIHLKKAYQFAKKNNDNFFLLTILKKLSVVNPQNSNSYFEEYQLINTIIINEEQRVKDISAKIKYQTEKKEKENQQLKVEKVEQTLILEKENKRKWFLVLGLLSVSLLSLIFYRKFNSEKKAKKIITEQKVVIETLQKDLHHRVKNNLAIINRFIDVVKEEFNNNAFDEKLIELQNRIASINEVHQQLYNNTDATKLGVKKYIEKLQQNIENTFANKNITIEQHIDDAIQLEADKLFPIGLIVNEFLTNSYKYAFADYGKGQISINMNESDNYYNLELADNGKGFPKGFNGENSKTFGLRIMKLLTQQINGTFKIEDFKGVKLTIQFPK